MSRAREYETPAARQAAHRKRKADEDAVLMDALYGLENAIWEASYRGDALALACRSNSLLGMLKRLTTTFETRSGDPEPRTSVEEEREPATQMP